ncbi:MAG TPA: hypothetical protein VFQ85_01635 [Mycobacteriales bacterium]|nr:hypothetical protein [Mycobacteriales bacterium]
MATTWGPDDEPRPERRRVGLPVAAAVAAFVGAGGEAAIRVVHDAQPFAPVWHSTRFPLLAALALAVSQVPRGRDDDDVPATVRPRRSELARHLDRRARRDDG